VVPGHKWISTGFLLHHLSTLTHAVFLIGMASHRDSQSCSSSTATIHHEHCGSPPTSALCAPRKRRGTSIQRLGPCPRNYRYWPFCSCRATSARLGARGYAQWSRAHANQKRTAAPSSPTGARNGTVAPSHHTSALGVLVFREHLKIVLEQEYGPHSTVRGRA